MAELPKTYDPSTVENKWYTRWKDGGYFNSDPDASKQPYTIVMPPPNVTGVLHMGHMLNNTIQDVLVRRGRMQGYNACWVPGTDHASIATEARVVAMLKEEGKTKEGLGRDEFLRRAREWKDKYGSIILSQLEKLGASPDWRRTKFTMDPEMEAAVQQAFIYLHEQGFIYRAHRMVNWDPVAQTALSDEEVLHREVMGKLYYVKYPLVGPDGEYIIVATTRPETILADMAIAVHPGDERYSNYVQEMARVRVPFIEREIPIIADEMVDPAFGTGMLKVTPGHSKVDYEIGQRHPLGLQPISVLDKRARLNDAFLPPRQGTNYDLLQSYVGLDRFVAREKMVADLDQHGLLERSVDHLHNVGHSERTGAVVEDMLSLQWWVRMNAFAKPALEAINNGEVRLIPSRFENTYRHWLENLQDWCISRQLWWGQRIPAWYHPDVGGEWLGKTKEEAKKRFGGASPEKLYQDPDVLDTWFSSWLWPITVFDPSIIGHPTKTHNADLNYYYPTQDLVTAPEILFFWVARMIMAGYEFTGKAPFKNVYLTGIVRDKLGRKMSKSLGNSPDPLALIDTYSADGVRMGMLLASPAGNDLPFDEALCEQGRNFANKLWNAFRLVQGWATQLGDGAVEPRQALAGAWMQARITQVALEMEAQFQEFRLSEALMSLYKLIWDDYCAWYLELCKPAAGPPMPHAVHAQAVGLLEELLKLLHPFMPFITEEIWQSLAPRSATEYLIITRLPTHQPLPQDAALLQDMELARELATALRAFRAEKGLSMKEGLQLYVRTSDQAFFEQYLPVMERFVNLQGYEFVNQPITGAFTLVVRAHELFIPLTGSVNLEDERDKILKELEYITGFITSVDKKLGNDKFMANAKEDVIAREQQKKADALARQAALRQSLAALAAVK